MAEAESSPVESLSFEAAMAELEKIFTALEEGNVPLERSISLYERGEALKARCDKLLKSAEDKVEKIRLSRDGQPTGAEPLDPE
ncbi:exodeoxyribonuclease VII small subunit [Notoacmeibacter sp. MSK16QG-6]|uniref:exodeoxyribonuclease VII small subunit n=1 Tax=Notoacmeibacter sp. MSK16QG-6 TaxID=2957982 RepID=UPI00209F1BA4|nr:exodeoxyribonuclease VII small subunit [Notoacmeibacter sp. MSK16QG-6]MCP1198232.1 exodeoxyribonuclease VII small subunit [Notoacmeibacter sp. MSK16QG-6]